ncbi:hypothetical protein BS78_05G233200 [Paspalum vaginatum]|nr:hypothetical protein BS78_05G233200 [Paspalum vaginatum]KAJ1276682.1 hypothetical protein BS78_05G233200 [Paspalum vaginatum]
MADPISIVQTIISLLVTINKLVGTFHTNQEDCSKIRTLVATAQAVVEPLKQRPKVMENKGMSVALKGLEEALQRSREVVESCKKKNAISRRIQSKDIAGDLRRVYEDISANMVLVDLANGINNNSMLADIMKSLADLRARDAYGSMLSKILEIIAAHPDVHLRREVEKLVHTYRGSTEHASDQNKKERKTKKTDVASRSEVKDEKDNVPAADIKVPGASLSDGSAKSTSAKSVVGQGGSSTGNKGSSHKSNPADGAGSTKEKENRIKEIHGRNTKGSKEKTNVPAGSKGSLSYAKWTSVKSVNVKGLPSIVKKIISRSTKNMTSVTSIDVHPAKPWIVTGHKGGNVSIWDFQKQKTVMELQVNEEPGKTARRLHSISRYIKDTPASHWVCSVKFITQEKWLSVGDGGGYIHVYAYTGTKLSKVTRFRAHHGNSVNTLAVHPTEPYLLSSSAFGKTIRLWNWSKGWMNIRKYDVKPMYPHGVLSLKFNPRDTNTFVCVTKDNRVKVGDITTSRLTTKLMGPFEADYFFTGSQAFDGNSEL